MFVRIGDAFVIFLAILVFFGIGVGIASSPEVFDKVLALFIGGQSIERFLFLFGNDVGDVGVPPLLISFLQLGRYFSGLGRRILAGFAFLFLLTRYHTCRGRN